MTPSEFVKKWTASHGGERATCQEHFIDLCQLLSEQTPNQADPTGDFYAFEKGAKTPDGDGFADVWLQGHFAWEYKGKRKDLGAAYAQVQKYREALGNPPLLVVCDIERFEIHTNWTNTEKWIYRFTLADLISDVLVEVTTTAGLATDAPKLNALQVLKAVFEAPEKLKPQKTTEQITATAARLFGEISEELRKWGVADERIARFVTRVMFCMFATDVGLLPKETFSEVVRFHTKGGDNEKFREHLADLFEVMGTGGDFGIYSIPHFNGELFDDKDVPKEITTQEILTLEELDRLNWSDVEPSIFGTLFVRILDPGQRTQLGAVFTSRADIELIVEPVLMTPLWNEWNAIKEQADVLLGPNHKKGKTGEKKAVELLRVFHQKLSKIRILDPACGSGNFLYVALALLKALEKEVVGYAGLHGISLKPRVHPRQLFGLEVNPYAHELASIVVWIGYLQWKQRNAMPLGDETPVLEPLDQVKLADAIVDGDAKAEPEWPKVDVIVGNPPFVGGKKLRTAVGDQYIDMLFSVWDRRVPREADLCCYWFEKARAAIQAGRAKRAGLLATQAIRRGKNRQVLERIKDTGDIFYAQADRPWAQDGVDVRVSMVGFDDGTDTNYRLNENKDDAPEVAVQRARSVATINANLTSGVDLTQARRLKENLGISFMGDTKVGPFEITESQATQFRQSPSPHGKPNSDVVRPWVNGLDLTRRPRNMWIVDFPPGMSEAEAAKYQAPFEYIKRYVKPFRATAKSGDATGVAWWIHQRPRPEMRAEIWKLPRYLGTPRVTKHRLFVWLAPGVLPDSRIFAFARSDDYFFGILQSHVHEVWALATSSRHGVGNDPTYNNTTCFETFPFPRANAAQRKAIEAAAKELNDLREQWLNPTGLIGDKDLRKRTLTNLYNERPTWLLNVHATLDATVFAAYGWTDERDDQELLARLLELNLEREAVE